MNADKVPYFNWCPRCSEGGFEKLTTYAHCVNCNYVEDYEPDSPMAQVISIENVHKLQQSQSDEECGQVIEFPTGA